MVLVIEALEAQRDYVPKVNVRLASIATFILRVARHEKWEKDAWKLLAAWGEEQTRVQEDDISTALRWWITVERWKAAGIEFTATALYQALCEVMLKHHIKADDLDWKGSADSLGKRIAANMKIYVKHFGLERVESKARNTRGGWSYRFKPTAEQLDVLRKIKTEEADAEAEVKRLREDGIMF